MSRDDTDVAIVGMSALFAGAGSLAQYWQNIVDGKCSIREAPDSWSYPYYDPESEDSARIYTRKGGFIADLTDFNPAEFGIMPNAIDGSDPDGFLVLRLAREALADAGYLNRDFDRARAGIIMGRGNYLNRGQTGLMQHGLVLDQTVQLIQQVFPDLSAEKLAEVRENLKRSLPPFGPETIPGLVPNLVTGRVANRLNLMGPNYLVDAACASTIIAIDQAIKELHSGRCDLVLAGGVHAASPPAVSMVFCQIGALSRGDLNPFGANAGGTLLGEGIGILALKRKADALRDGDRVYAVVKGVGIASDGQAKGLLAPRLEGEVLAIERGYSVSGVEPATIGLVEAHGTGIPLGDQTELAALTQVFGERQGELPACALGSVKSMIGHCLPAAGAAGVIKAALAVYHKVLPGTLCEEPSPALPFATSRFYVNNRTRPWIHGSRNAPRRAAVNSFGFGGINAHVILEEAAEPEMAEAASYQWPTEVVAICGDTREALLTEIDQLLEVLAGPAAPRLCDLAYTLACVPPARVRLVVISSSNDELAKKLARAREALKNPDRHRMQARSGVFYDDSPQVQGQTAFLFPGEGAQYTNMLADLCLAFPGVRRWFDRLDEAFSDQRATPPSAIIFPAPTGLSPAQRQAIEERLFAMDLGSEVVSISNLALAELLRELGVPCDVMLGHSTGEFVALVASGILPDHDGPAGLLLKMRELHERHQDMERSGSIVTGTLLAVGAVDHEQICEVVAEAGEGVYLAMDNCHNQAVLFAPTAKADALKARLKSLGAIVLSLPFDRAYHTPLFESVSASIRAYYDTAEVAPAHTPLYSCSTAELFPDHADGIRHTAAQQFSSRVRFRETVLKMSARGVRTFVEVGPRDNLTAFVKDILQDREHVAIASNVQRVPALRQIQNLLAELFVRGTVQDLQPLFANRACVKLDPGLASKPVNRGMRLNIEMPVIAMTRPWPLQQQELQAPPVRKSSKVVELHPAPTAAAPSANPGTVSRHAEPAIPTQAPAAAVTVATPPSAAATDPRLFALQAHFNLMNDFMAQQGRMMQSISGGVAAVAAPQAQALIMSTEHYPLLGEVVSRQPGRLVAVRSCTAEQDLYLRDHTIGVGVPISVLQPDQLALPVVPLTFSMESIAEAAHCLTGGHGRISGMHDVVGYRWIALERGRAVHLRITAELQSTPSAKEAVVHVQVEEVDTPDASSGRLTFEGRVEVAPAYPYASAPMAVSGAPLAASITADADLYRGSMFHGPLLRGVTHIRGLSEDRIEADMVTLPVDELFAFTRAPRFQLDPALLDACGQLLGFWSFERVDPAANLFPVQIKRLELFAPRPPAGTSLIGRAAIRREPGGQTLEANIEVADQQGRPLLRLSGWNDRVFLDNTAQHFHNWRLDPPRSYLSEPRLGSEPAVVARGLTPARAACLRGAGGVWFKAAAHIVLTPAERERWYAFPESGTQREEWLLGYITAKDAARQWLQETHGLELAPIDLELLTDADGRLYLHSDFAGGIVFPGLALTAGSGHVAACIAREPGSLSEAVLERFAAEVIQQQCGLSMAG